MLHALALALALPAAAQVSWSGPDPLSQFQAAQADAPEVPALPEGVVVEPELSCRPEVLEAMKKAWALARYGRVEYEAAFRVDRSEAGDYSVAFATMTFESLRLSLDIGARTVAIVHTHPDVSVHHPADKDFNSRVPNYVVSSRGLTVTVPGTKRWKTVRRRWDRGCDRP